MALSIDGGAIVATQAPATPSRSVSFFATAGQSPNASRQCQSSPHQLLEASHYNSNCASCTPSAQNVHPRLRVLSDRLPFLPACIPQAWTTSARRPAQPGLALPMVMIAPQSAGRSLEYVCLSHYFPKATRFMMHSPMRGDLAATDNHQTSASTSTYSPCLL